MDVRFSRNVPALSEDECRLLKGKRVLIVGCGGIGGYLVELLLRAGVETLRVCDGDVFESTNINRQLLAQASNMGQSKAQAAALRGRQIRPEATVEALCMPMDEHNAAHLIAGCDVVLDALDNIESRKLLARACARAGIPYIFGAIGGWIAQAALCMPGDGLIERLYPEGTVLRDRSVLSFTPALCASVQAALCVKLLVGRPAEAGKLYYFDLLNQEFETIPI